MKFALFYWPAMWTMFLGYFMIHSFKTFDEEWFQEDLDHIILFAMAIISKHGKVEWKLILGICKVTQ